MTSRRTDGGADAVVVGAGVNGLVAANLVADAGWSVVVLEQQPTAGGAVRTDSEVADDFRHDTFSAFYPFAAASPVMASLDLERWGLRWCHAPAVLGNPLPDGSWALLTRDRESVAARFDRAHPGDGAAWLELVQQWDAVGPALMGSLLSPFPPVRHGVPLLARLAREPGLATARALLSGVRSLGEERFGGEGPRLLLAGNAGHADFSPEGAGSGIFGLIMTMLGQTVGFPAPEGGAGALTDALVRRLEDRGGEVRLGVDVAEVQVEAGRAVAVRTADGERLAAGRAVLADVAAPRLYGGLVADRHLPARTRHGIARFAWDPATVKVDWALSDPVPWDPAPEVAPGCVHICDSVDELTLTSAQVAAGSLPARPFLLTGQMTTTDPTRSPPGTESFWAYTHVPQQVRADAGADDLTGDWDRGDAERFADRMQARLERYAPGFGSRVIARRVLSPPELERRNANLVGGAINGGTAQLQQSLVFRPVPGLGRAGTPIRGLFLAGASAHPGGGVHGAPGANAARAALAADRRAALRAGRR
ncbi:NAD(P)/FAD-dependent oxidoreductase [Nocardioides sp.]|uniref:phytoene desaturase family protein n=1 Tax=Nocardioides sp. TaxID=35761 RepID=UPI002ED3EC1C